MGNYSQAETEFISLIAKVIDAPHTNLLEKLCNSGDLLNQVPSAFEMAILSGFNQSDIIDIQIEKDSTKYTFIDEHNEEYVKNGWEYKNQEWKPKRNHKGNCLIELIEEIRQKDFTNKYSIMALGDYYRQYPLLFEKDKKGTDIHYAERKFIENIAAPLLGISKLTYLIPQFPFTDSDGKIRRIDFVIEAEKKWAIEIDGRAYHSKDRIKNQKQDDEYNRQNDMSAQGFEVIRFWADMVTDSKKIDETIKKLRNYLKTDNKLKNIIPKKGINYIGQEISPEFSEHVKYLVQIPLLYRRLQLNLFEYIIEQQPQSLTILAYKTSSILVATALYDLYNIIEKLSDLYKINLPLPQSILILSKDVDLNDHEIWKNYINEMELSPDKLRLNPISIETTYDDNVKIDIIINLFNDASIEKTDLQTVIIKSDDLNLDNINHIKRKFNTQSSEIWPIEVIKMPIDFFVRRNFGLPGLYNEQFKVLINIIVNKQNTLVILPTGQGKSLNFQLPGLILPGGVIIVSPLRALMKDQVSNLLSMGINQSDYITSDLKTKEKELNYRNFVEGFTNILYLSPERLQIKSFAEQASASLKNRSITILAVDEAHCVSEWGHDFRPSYLHLPYFIKILNKKPPLLALTATASKLVKNDICKILNISENNIIRPDSRSLRRNEISFSVHIVNKETISKTDEIVRVMQNDLQIAFKYSLGKDRIDSIIDKGEQDTFYRNCGVIFSIYADAHNRTNINDSVPVIAEKLADYDFIKEVRHYASKPPQTCPHCGSYNFISISNTFTCNICERSFDKPNETMDWDKTLFKNQDEFKISGFPILVATKGYGMGIDKRNIRFIIHQGMSSSIESYYQEAGRAGRDGEHAHCALVTRLPDQQCWNDCRKEREKDVTAYPSCMRGSWFKKRECPYMLPELCDFGKQIHFLAKSYPKDETMKTNQNNIIDLIAEQYANHTKPIIIDHGKSDNDKTKNERVICLLLRMGLIDEYWIEYTGLKKSHMLIQINDSIPYERIKKYADDLIAYAKQTSSDNNKSNQELSNVYKIDKNSDVWNDIFWIKCITEEVLKAVTLQVRVMKISTMIKLVDYAWNTKLCRAGIFDVEFGIEQTAVSDCKFCDVCVPGIAFSTSSANPPRCDGRYVTIKNEMEKSEDKYDMKQCQTVVEQAVNNKMTNQFASKAETNLTHQPNNLASLYIAAHLRAQEESEESRSRAIVFAKRGFDAANYSGQSYETKEKFIDIVGSIDDERLFDIIDSSKNNLPIEMVYSKAQQYNPLDERTAHIGLRCFAETITKTIDKGTVDQSINALNELCI